MADGRLVQVFVWKQGDEPDPDYVRQILRVAAPAALGPPGPDGEPTIQAPVTALAGPEDWPANFWSVVQPVLHGSMDYADSTRYDLSGWQGDDARHNARLFVVSVYEKPAALTGQVVAAPAFGPAPIPPPAAAGYGGPGPGQAPPVPSGPPPAVYTPPSNYSATPGAGPGPGAYATPGYPSPAPLTPGYGTRPIGPFPPPAPPPGGYGPPLEADAYPGHTGITGDDLTGGTQGFYGGFGQRLVAGIIDLIVLGIILAVPFFCTLAFSSQDTSAENSNGTLAFCGLCCLSIVLVGLYLGGFWLWRGQTPGKIALGLRVVGADGQPPHAGRVLLRVVGYFMSSLILGLGFLLAAFDEAKQGLHDHMAGTYVVPVQPPNRRRPPGLPGYPPAPAPAAPAPASAASAPPPPAPAAASAPVAPGAPLSAGFMSGEMGAATGNRMAAPPPPTGVQWSAPSASAPSPEATPPAPTTGVQWGAAPTASSPSVSPWAPPPSWSPPAVPEVTADTAIMPAPVAQEAEQALAPSAPPAPPVPAAPAPPAPADGQAAEAFRQGLELLAEGVREPGGTRTLLIVEPEAGQAATRVFEAATAADPSSAIYRYFLGVARRYGEGYSAAQPEFQQAMQADPQLWEAHLQLYFGTRWHDAFAYPDWSPRATSLPAVLHLLRPPRPGTRLVIVREGGAKTVAALCVSARSAWQQLPTMEMPARIELVPAHAPYGSIIALYVALRDNPANPYRGETFLNPAEALAPDGDATQLGQNLLLQLARQRHTYLIFVDENGTILLNRRLVFDDATLANLATVAQEVQTLAAGPILATERFTQAAQWHMDQYPLDRIVV